MAKLIALALTFTALVAFATAHTTIITTTIKDDYQRQCSRQLQGQNLNQCRMYLQQGQDQDEGQSPYEVDIPQREQEQSIQQCCQQLQDVDEQCQCEAVRQVFQDAQQQQQGRSQGQQQIGPFGADQQTRQLRQRAEMIPDLCKLQSRRQCQIGSIMTTTTTVTDDSSFEIPFWPFGSKQCSQSEIQRPVNKCQKYVEEQIWSPRTLLRMSIRRQGQQEQSPQQCCKELQNVRRECQCEAIKEVAKEAMQQLQQQQQQGSRQQGRQQQQQGSRQQGRQQQQDETREMVRSVVQNLPNQCELDVQQCDIPYRMF